MAQFLLHLSTCPGARLPRCGCGVAGMDRPQRYVIASRLHLAAKQSPIKRLTLIDRHHPLMRGESPVLWGIASLAGVRSLAMTSQLSLERPLQNINQIRRVFGDGPGPMTKAAMLIDGVYPFGEVFAFDEVLLVVLSFDFEDKGRAVG